MEQIVTGIVIYNNIYKENDALIAVLTQTGEKIMFRAKGILRITSKNSPSCQIFTTGEFELEFKTENSNKVLKVGKVISSPKNLYLNYKSSIAAMLIVDLIDKVTIDNCINPQLYLILKDSINYLNCKHNTENVLIITMLKILKELGTQIQLDGCSFCGTKENIVSVRIDQGGYICNVCNEQMQATVYPKEFLRDFRYLVKSDFKNCDLFNVKSKFIIHLLELMRIHLEENLGIYINTKNASLIFSNKFSR